MSLNVLIVDDCELVRGLMVKTLTLSKLPISGMFEAGNGREALTILSEEWIDLIVTDLNMPLMNGVEMIDRLHQDGLLKTIPIVVVSTEGSATRIDDLTRKGVAAYLRKPISPEAIRDAVLDVVGHPDEGDWRHALEDAFCIVVEGFALMIGELDEQGPGATPQDWVQAKLSFHGPSAGVLAVAAPQELVREMASNILGVDSDGNGADEAAPDALKEFANLLCGRIATAVGSEEAVFDLSVPVYGGVDAEDWLEQPGRTISTFSVEGFPLHLSLAMRT